MKSGEPRHRDLVIGVTAAKRIVEMARELYLRGLADYEAVLRSTVAIYKALP